jgi:hypothetical protein
MVNWQNSKLIKWQTYEIAGLQNSKLVKWQVGEMASW